MSDRDGVRLGHAMPVPCSERASSSLADDRLLWSFEGRLRAGRADSGSGLPAAAAQASSASYLTSGTP